MGKNHKMRMITLLLPQSYLDELEELVAARFYANRSEAIRNAVRDLIVRETGFCISKKENKEKVLVKRDDGTVRVH